jgi:hypothetical protein
MNEPTKIKWRMAGEEIGNCNCNWGCPCQFNAVPTTGHCEALLGWQISDGYFGATRLDGVRFARIYWWPGAIHEGNGVRRTIIRIPGIAESDTEPIKNPVSGEEHRARIVLPNGFEYKEAEMGNTVNCRVSAGDKLTFELENTYAQLNAFDWSN